MRSFSVNRGVGLNLIDSERPTHSAGVPKVAKYKLTLDEAALVQACKVYIGVDKPELVELFCSFQQLTHDEEDFGLAKFICS
jgi:hypothetical protein